MLRIGVLFRRTAASGRLRLPRKREREKNLPYVNSELHTLQIQIAPRVPVRLLSRLRGRAGVGVPPQTPPSESPPHPSNPMQYAPSDLKPRERYKVLASFVLPRPIAWVTTVG